MEQIPEVSLATRYDRIFQRIQKLIADTLYNMLAVKLRGFEHCDAAKIYRNFVRGKALFKIRDDKLIVTYPRRAHNPVLRSVPWHRLPTRFSWLGGIQI